MVVEGGSCEKDLRLVGQRVPQTRGGIMEGTMREFKHEGEGWKERRRW